MTVEDKRSAASVIGDKFPAGLRVLAVDDDPICLKVLENLLRKCQYHVTITNQSITALKMLRENRDKYDLVISDVNMPDMDGFKLLELVGLEMDLPVIMLSAHGDKELVYKGVTHGAVDYLLKPVRIEELKNIWQHVIRKKKFRSSNVDGPLEETGEVGQGADSTGSTDQSGKLNRKRKDQDVEEEEEGDDNEEPGTQKKPRVVWSVELHRKFVAAVNQLGLDKAVPKKILDLMNVEGLTRENVASHLQKYRLYLKRISGAASQHANMVAGFGGKDSSYLRMGSLDGFGDFRMLCGPGRISSTSLSSYPPSGMLGRLNSPACLTMHGITASGLLQPGHSQTLSNSVNDFGKMQPTLLPANQVTNLFQGNSSTQEHNKFQSKSATHIGEVNCSDDATCFSLANTFPDARVTINGMGNPISTASSNPLMLQSNAQQSLSRGAFATQSSISVAPMNQESSDIGVSNFLDHSRLNENWQGSTQLSKFSSKPQPTNNMRDNISTSAHMGNRSIAFFSSSAVAAPLENSRLVDIQDQAGLMDNLIQNMDYSSTQRLEEHSQDYNPNLNSLFSSVSSLVSGDGGMYTSSLSMDQRKRFGTSLLGQLSNGVPSMSLDPKLRSNEDCLTEQGKSLNGSIQNNFESLDDIMDVVTKREQSKTALMDGEFGFDPYSLGSCM